MQIYQLDEIINLINHSQPVCGILAESGCFIKIENYLPIICASIHSGKQLPQSLKQVCTLNESERYLGGSPLCDELIDAQPITLICLDSLFEYDLNQPKALCTRYQTSANTPLWRNKLTNKQVKSAQLKHSYFFQVYDLLLRKLESLYKHIIVFDIRSSQTVAGNDMPTFIIDSSQLNLNRWASVVDKLKYNLGQITIPNVKTLCSIQTQSLKANFLATHTNTEFERTLIIPIEISRLYMDESGTHHYPLVIDALKLGLKNSLSGTSAYLQRVTSANKKLTKADMLGSSIDPYVLTLDTQLYRLSQKFSTLKYINPKNLVSEKKRFLSAPSRFKPKFTYLQLTLDANEFKRQLYRLDIHKISDPAVKRLYSDIINNLSSQVDLLTSVATDRFLHHSLGYYGKPDSDAINNAQFLLYAKPLPEPEERLLSASDAAELMSTQAKAWGMNSNVSLSASLLAKAMIKSSPTQLVVNLNANFSASEVQRLIAHELGVHMATSLNSKSQGLKILRLGLPGTTQTQEGLAILAELASGHMAHSRLNMLACRVLAVNSMIKEQDFYQTYSYLVDELSMENDAAFTTTARVYRGGGFTKDHLYLSGFLQMLSLSNQRDLTNLFVGKTSHQYLDLIDELVTRQWIKPAKYTPCLQQQAPTESAQKLNYLIESLRT
ncbi:flavohemoglobin expression-modulating QEGLA motif protein [Shewanella sp. UCD-KL12]|uniref:flavohemoglobin expression-modulating QEGLA motif protein n=1 Tax=Shewanella sp. UCD-KL12 TaxID=1917163 RepID=UPI0009709261|nr:flavohemoglobin expression-modulating QEGLA motif protein [Shewanella sp. UCD-KL12]